MLRYTPISSSESSLLPQDTAPNNPTPIAKPPSPPQTEVLPYVLQDLRPSEAPESGKTFHASEYLKTSRSSFSPFSCDGWGWEIFGCGLSLLALLATILNLNHYSGHATPVVLPHNIKLGSVLSLLATIIKGAVALPTAAGLSQIIY